MSDNWDLERDIILSQFIPPNSKAPDGWTDGAHQYFWKGDNYFFHVGIHGDPYLWAAHNDIHRSAEFIRGFDRIMSAIKDGVYFRAIMHPYETEQITEREQDNT